MTSTIQEALSAFAEDSFDSLLKQYGLTRDVFAGVLTKCPLTQGQVKLVDFDRLLRQYTAVPEDFSRYTLKVLFGGLPVLVTEKNGAITTKVTVKYLQDLVKGQPGWCGPKYYMSVVPHGPDMSYGTKTGYPWWMKDDPYKTALCAFMVQHCSQMELFRVADAIQYPNIRTSHSAAGLPELAREIARRYDEVGERGQLVQFLRTLKSKFATSVADWPKLS